jgi:hypothetical protein
VYEGDAGGEGIGVTGMVTTTVVVAVPEGVDNDEGGVGVNGVVIKTVVVAGPDGVTEELVYGIDSDEGTIGVTGMVTTTVVVTTLVELDGTDGEDVGVIGTGGNTEVEGKTGAVELAGLVGTDGEEVGVIGIGGITVVEGKTGTVELPIELEGMAGNEVGVIGTGENTDVEGKTGTVELTGGGPLYPDVVAGAVEFAGALVVGMTGTEVLLYEVGITGTKVVEVTFTVVGPVAVELRVNGGAVPVADVAGNELVLLPHGADG